MGIFSVMDWPYGIRVYRNPVKDGFGTVGTWETTSITPVEIKGHITPYTSRDSAESNIRETGLGAIEQGMFRFFTAETPPFTKGDVLEVDQDLAGTVKFRYTVVDRVRSHHLIAKYSGEDPRFEYLVREQPR